MSANKNRAFTLIELLVVVLIIGILAAVALPQYTASVERSRLSQAFVMVRAMADAGERYFLENNEYPTTFEELDITIPNATKTAYCTTAINGTTLTDCLDDGDFAYELWPPYGFNAVRKPQTTTANNLSLTYYHKLEPMSDLRNKFACHFNTTAPNAAKYEKICKTFGGTLSSASGGGYNYYIVK